MSQRCSLFCVEHFAPWAIFYAQEMIRARPKHPGPAPTNRGLRYSSFRENQGRIASTWAV